MQEIERKYLVNKDKWTRTSAGEQIKQAYISDDPERTVRVRIKKDNAFLTIKGKSEGISRTEMEYEIPVKDARVLMEMAKRPPVEKTRFKEEFAGFTWEIDVFSGENEGLIMAEIELEEESQEFEKPEWVEKEVSGDSRFFNLSLSQKPFSTWSK